VQEKKGTGFTLKKYINTALDDIFVLIALIYHMVFSKLTIQHYQENFMLQIALIKIILQSLFKLNPVPTFLIIFMEGLPET
jgi:cadmium resistance protein CadD (predicted permease)